MPITVTLTLTKNAIGAKLVGGEFEFSLFDQLGAKITDARNAANGAITFELSFDDAGSYTYTLEETDAPTGWIRDSKVYPVEIEIAGDADDLTASVSYPDGHPGFINKLEADPCSLIVFPALNFDEPGTYEYVLKELSTSGGGWTTDNAEFRVIITVTDDGYGNLIATIDYPDGFPEFTNTYTLQPVTVVISAIKFAVGGDLPCGRFEFGLFDEDGNLVATAYNGAS